MVNHLAALGRPICHPRGGSPEEAGPSESRTAHPMKGASMSTERTDPITFETLFVAFVALMEGLVLSADFAASTFATYNRIFAAELAHQAGQAPADDGPALHFPAGPDVYWRPPTI